jgi:hypothetical protein
MDEWVRGAVSSSKRHITKAARPNCGLIKVLQEIVILWISSTRMSGENEFSWSKGKV